VAGNAEQDAFAVRRPMEIFDPAFDTRRCHRDTTIEQIKLKIAVAVTVGKECDHRAVGRLFRRPVGVGPERHHARVAGCEIDPADARGWRAIQPVRDRAGEESVISVGRDVDFACPDDSPGARLAQRFVQRFGFAKKIGVADVAVHLVVLVGGCHALAGRTGSSRCDAAVPGPRM
jgi:hypothetical protein